MISRIDDRATFRAFRRAPVRLRRGPLAIAYLPPDGAERRAAFAVGRAVGPAVVRNRIRRRLRAILREEDVAGRVPAGSYLVRADRDAAALGYQELRALLADVLRACASDLATP